MTDERISNGGSAGTSPAPVKGRRGGKRLVIGLIVVLLLAYVASPYASFWFFSRAIKARDRAAIESFVDFPSVRQSLKDELRGRLPKADAAKKEDSIGGLMARLGPSLVDQLVDAFVTPDGLVALISDPELGRRAKAKDPSVVARVGTGAPEELGWNDVRYAFFTGPRDFLVDVKETKLRFRFSGLRWVLKRVELPAQT